jgi:hypothetical protein
VAQGLHAVEFGGIHLGQVELRVEQAMARVISTSKRTSEFERPTARPSERSRRMLRNITRASRARFGTSITAYPASRST